jgi:hypothetical protein
MLPVDNPGARTLLIRSCAFVGPAVATFEADLVSANETIDDEIKSDILGARRTILFTEGTDKSLDKPLYSLVFPNTSVVAKESCRDVERVVCGIRDSDGLHWVTAFGIVDNDGRTQENIDQLKAKGIYAVPIYSVESIYYHPDIQRRIAERHAAVTGDDAPTRLANAKLAALAAVRLHIPRLSELAALRAIRKRVLGHLPTKEKIAEGSPIEISINVAALTLVERKRLQAIVDGDDFLAIVSHYPVRETPALTEIAAKLGFRNRDQYEGAVRKLVIDDVEALTFVRSLFGTLGADLAAA